MRSGVKPQAAQNAQPLLSSSFNGSFDDAFEDVRRFSGCLGGVSDQRLRVGNSCCAHSGSAVPAVLGEDGRKAVDTISNRGSYKFRASCQRAGGRTREYCYLAGGGKASHAFRGGNASHANCWLATLVTLAQAVAHFHRYYWPLLWAKITSQASVLVCAVRA